MLGQPRVSLVSVVGGWEKRRGRGKQRVSLAFGLPLLVACASNKGCLGASRPFVEGLLGRAKALTRLGYIYHLHFHPHCTACPIRELDLHDGPHCDTSRYTAIPPPSPPSLQQGAWVEEWVGSLWPRVKGKGNSRGPRHGDASTTAATGVPGVLAAATRVPWPARGCG